MSNYDNATWDHYARTFHSVSPSLLIELNRFVASELFGNVVDFGCGAAKIAPFVVENSNVRSYTGIDCSAEMIRYAKESIATASLENAIVKLEAIENIPVATYDSGVSINSYYAWKNPDLVLQSIYHALADKALLVLVTPNPHIDMQMLLRESEMELHGHPDWSIYKSLNLDLCATAFNFATLDTVVATVRDIGFFIEEASQTFYHGGLSYLRLRK